MNTQMQETNMEEIEDTGAPPPAARHNRILLAVIGSALLLISGLMLYNSISTYLNGIMALQYKTTDARVIKVEEHFDALGIRKEVRIRYAINGEEKKALVPMPQGRVMKRGELTVAYYDQNNPENAVISQEIDYDSIIVLGAFGLFILCFGVLISSRALAGKQVVAES